LSVSRVATGNHDEQEKKMKKAVVLPILVGFVVCPLHGQERSAMTLVIKGSHGREARAASARQGVDEKTRNILARFLEMLISFFSIVQNPKDSAKVTANVTNMFSGMVNIIAESVKLGNFSGFSYQ
jgi:hypothetical protein